MGGFTKGPWVIGGRHGHNCGFVYARDGKDAHHDTAICQVYGIHNGCMAEDVQSTGGYGNISLIAAAPDLLEALEEAISMLGSRLIKDTFGYDWHEKATQAIARSRGEA